MSRCATSPRGRLLFFIRMISVWGEGLSSYEPASDPPRCHSIHSLRSGLPPLARGWPGPADSVPGARLGRLLGRSDPCLAGWLDLRIAWLTAPRPGHRHEPDLYPAGPLAKSRRLKPALSA